MTTSENYHVKYLNKPLMGAHAMGLGAVISGCDYFTGYPITPQTELLEFASEHIPLSGGIFQQLSDEISCIMACYGGSAAGKRVMTASVGPGLTLMIDGIANAAGAELPLVIGAITRAHVGVSSALLPAQSDMAMLKGGGNGDYHIPIYAPSSVTEIVELTIKAFNTADIYRTPVFVAIDGYLSNLIETCNDIKTKPDLFTKKLWSVQNTPSKQFIRNVSPFKTPEADTAMGFRLQEKYTLISKEETLYENYLTDDADFLIIAYGIMGRIAKEACNICRSNGVKVGLFRPITIFPFPEKPIHRLASQTKAILVCEINFGQILLDVKLAVEGKCKVAFLGQPANPIPPDALIHAIEELAQGKDISQRTIDDVHPGYRPERNPDEIRAFVHSPH